MPAPPSPIERAHAWLHARLAGRHLLALARDLTEGELVLRAQALVYSTLLSLVPLLAVSFATLKGFGVHNQLEPWLGRLLEPLGTQGADIARGIVGFVENINVGTLGALGLAVLFYTVVSVMQKVESALNHAWRVERHRTLAQRIAASITALVLGPVLVLATLGLSGALFASSAVQGLLGLPGLEPLLGEAGRLLPSLLLTVAFTLVYKLVPNTRVRWRAALVGGVGAALLWQLAGWGFSHFIAGSRHYALVYAAFATTLVFMLWLFVAWLVLLAGASIAFHVQHPEHLASPVLRPRLGPRDTERLALAAAALVAAGYAQGAAGWTLAGLARRLGVPASLLEAPLSALERAGLLARSVPANGGLGRGLAAEAQARYLLTRAPETVTAADILRVLRDGPANAYPLPPGEDGSRIDALMDRVEQAASTAAADTSLRELGDGVATLGAGGETAHSPGAHSRQPSSSG